MIDLSDPAAYDEWDRYLFGNAKARCAYRYHPLTARDLERWHSWPELPKKYGRLAA